MKFFYPLISEFHNVLSSDECKNIIDFCQKDFTELTVIGKESDNGIKFRVGQGAWINKPIYDKNKIDLNLKLKRIVWKLTELPIENQESVHVVRYTVGGEYKEHHDFFHANHQDYDYHLQKGGQRVFSALFYLNDNFSGGETRFTKKNINVCPKQGKLLLWSNLNIDGSLDYDSIHAGMPVECGEKYIAIIWVREKKFH